MTYTLHEITGLNDPHLPAVMDIYQEAFPLDEQMRFSWWLALLKEKEAGRAAHRHPLALLRDDQVVAMAYYQVKSAQEDGAAEPVNLGYLWYLGTREDLRGTGIGPILYQEMAARLVGESCRALVFEVEIPEEAALESEQAAEYARRRIAWYRRQGAKLLTGIHYVQDVGWQPPLEMHVMVHPFQEMDAERAFAVANIVLGNGVTRRESLNLE